MDDMPKLWIRKLDKEPLLFWRTQRQDSGLRKAKLASQLREGHVRVACSAR